MARIIYRAELECDCGEVRLLTGKGYKAVRCSACHRMYEVPGETGTPECTIIPLVKAWKLEGAGKVGREYQGDFRYSERTVVRLEEAT